jgi:hypothetical protein
MYEKLRILNFREVIFIPFSEKVTYNLNCALKNKKVNLNFQVEKTDIEKKKKPVPIVFSITNLLRKEKRNFSHCQNRKKSSPYPRFAKKRHN